MRMPLLILSMIFYTTFAFTQDSTNVWVDYVMGKPNMSYFEAKKALAKEWGINYKPQFMGCKMTDEMQAEQKAQRRINAQYFAKLEEQHGVDWQEKFNFELKKRLPFAQNLEHQVWEYPLLGRPNSQRLEAQKAVAQAWGINFKPVILGCVPNKPGVQERRAKAHANSQAYLQAIADHFGQDWREKFEAEVNAKYKALQGQ